jgi:hypothetical protein
MARERGFDFRILGFTGEGRGSNGADTNRLLADYRKNDQPSGDTGKVRKFVLQSLQLRENASATPDESMGRVARASRPRVWRFPGETQRSIAATKDGVFLNSPRRTQRGEAATKDGVITTLPLALSTPDCECAGKKIPAMSVTAFHAKNGKLHISLVNTNPNAPATVRCDIAGLGVGTKRVSSRMLTAPAINSVNTFDVPRTVEPKNFPDTTLNGETLTVTLPAKAIVTLE